MHNIFNERFYSHREPAWHGLGHVSEEALGAVEAFAINPYDLELEQLVTASGVEVPVRAIIRSATPDDPEARYFNVVGMEYQLVTPQTVCEIWDREVEVPIETWGALGRGETFFLTSKMPEADVKGDPMQNYLLISAPMDGTGSLQIRITPVRVVCQNTLIAARRETTQVYKIKHDSEAIERFTSWLPIAYGKANESLDLLMDFFRVFAEHDVSKLQVTNILKKVYPDPRPPERNAPADVMERRQENFEINKAWLHQSRDLVKELFEGAGMGLNEGPTQGTAWGLYNAVAELEDYRGAGRGGRNPLARPRDALFGWRAATKEKAFDVIRDHLKIPLD